MAGFALIVGHQTASLEEAFDCFLARAAAWKQLAAPGTQMTGHGCSAAKLDGPFSLHRGITRDAQSGSWLLAVGTVVDTARSTGESGLETLLADYLRLGEQVFARLDGQFALVIHDGRDGKTLVVSDPFSMIPVYVSQKGGRVYVSTSALAVAEAAAAQPDDFGIRSFLLYGTAFGSTLWRGVNMLPPATVLEITQDGARQAKYWTFAVDEALARLSEADAVDCMIDQFTASLNRAVGQGAELWVSLTGGMDSRTLAALAHYARIPFKAYTHGPADSKDVRIARRISETMGWDFEYFPLPEDWGVQRACWIDRALGQTDGLLDVIKMSRTIREQAVKAAQRGVSLWGYGGELYRGYYWKQEFWRAGASTRVNYDRLMDYRVIPSSSLRLRDEETWRRSLHAEVRSRFEQIGEQRPTWRNTTKLDLIGQLMEHHACAHTIGAVIGQQRVVLPFYFKQNLVCNFSLNYRWRQHGRLFRMILERINPKLAQMEIADGGPALPMRLSNLHRFVPYWIDTGEKLLWRMGHKATGKALWRRRDAGPQGRSYPTERWLAETLEELRDRRLIDPDHMVTERLYSPDWLKSIRSGSQPGEKLTGRMLAVEMAMRIVMDGGVVTEGVEQSC